MKNVLYFLFIGALAFSTAQADNLWRNPDVLETSFFGENAWINEQSKEPQNPVASDTLRQGSDHENGFVTNATGTISIKEVQQFGGTFNFTDSAFTATYRYYLRGGTLNISSTTGALFKTSDAFIIGDDGQSYVNLPAVLNVSGDANLEDNNWGFCFGESAKKYATIITVSDSATLKGKLGLGSKTDAEGATTTMTLEDNASVLVNRSGFSMLSNATLYMKDNAQMSATTGDSKIYDTQNNTVVVFDMSGASKFTNSYKIYQAKGSIVNMSEDATITTADYFLGTTSADGSNPSKAYLNLAGDALLQASGSLNAYGASEINMQDYSNLRLKNLYLDSAKLVSTATPSNYNETINLSNKLTLINSATMELSESVLKTYQTEISGNSTIALKNGATFTSTNLFTATTGAKLTVDNSIFKISRRDKSQGFIIDGASVVYSGTTEVYNDRIAMFNNGEMVLKGSKLKTDGWCIGADLTDAKYNDQKGTIRFVADADGISTLNSNYIDYNFDILLDFTSYVIEGEKTFTVVKVNGYYDRVKNWYDHADELVSIIKANPEDSFEYSYNSGKFLITYIHVVPEPSTCAAILGALALGFVAYRKRK